MRANGIQLVQFNLFNHVQKLLLIYNINNYNNRYYNCDILCTYTGS